MQKNKSTISFTALPPQLDDFIGDENAILINTVKDFASGRLLGEHSIYLWGEPHCGKTHLLRAAVAYSRQFQASSFFATNDELPPPLSGFLAVDDVHDLNISSQTVLLNWHNHAYQRASDSQSLILMSGNSQPFKLPIREDLAARLAGGLVFRVRLQSDDEKQQTLERFAARHGFNLPPEICNLLLSRLPRDITSLAFALADLDSFLLSEKKPLNIKQARLWISTYETNSAG